VIPVAVDEEETTPIRRETMHEMVYGRAQRSERWNWICAVLVVAASIWGLTITVVR